MGNREFWLTDREREVLELVTEGMTAKEIGRSLAIAPCTVERHVENVRLKTRARNRCHMISMVLFSGALKSFEPVAAHA